MRLGFELMSALGSFPSFRARERGDSAWGCSARSLRQLHRPPSSRAQAGLAPTGILATERPGATTMGMLVSMLLVTMMAMMLLRMLFQCCC